MTYGELREQMGKMHIQFSAASSLSKDPKTKMEQIYILEQMGMVNPAMKASLMEFPDLEGAYSVETASYDYCQTVIQRAVEDDDYQYYGIVDLKQLFGEVQNALLRFDSANEDKKTLDRLVKLLKKVMADQSKVNQVGQPHPLPAPPPGQPAPIGGQPIQQPQGVPMLPPQGQMNPGAPPPQGGMNG